MLNCPPSWRPAEDSPNDNRLREAIALSPQRQIVLHHGQFKPDRGIAQLIRAADDPRIRELDPAIVLLGFGRLRPILEDAARHRPGRLFVLPAVPADELLDWISGADVAYLGCPPLTLNLRLTLPNKVFESLMAGVPMIAAQGTEQARLIEREGVGTAVDINRPDDLAGAIANLLAMPAAERAALRRRCRERALSDYSWEVRSRPLVDLYRQL